MLCVTECAFVCSCERPSRHHGGSGGGAADHLHPACGRASLSHRGQSIEVLQRVPPTAAGAADTTRFISLNGLTLDDQTATATSPPPAGEAHRADRPTVLDGREGRKPAGGVAEPGQSPPPGGTAEQRRPPPVGGSSAGSGPVPPPRPRPPPAGDETATVNVASRSRSTS